MGCEEGVKEAIKVITRLAEETGSQELRELSSSLQEKSNEDSLNNLCLIMPEILRDKRMVAFLRESDRCELAANLLRFFIDDTDNRRRYNGLLGQIADRCRRAQEVEARKQLRLVGD